MQALTCQREYHIFNLLPYNENSFLSNRSTLIRILESLSFIIQNIKETLYDIISNDIQAFDPHVGESLCQIRACQMIEIFKGFNRDYDFKNDINVLFNETESMDSIVNKLIIKISNDSYSLVKRESIISFLRRKKINLTFNKDIFTLVLSRFLSKYKKFDDFDNSVIDYISLEFDSKFPKNYLRRLIHYYQKTMSYISCNYIFALRETYKPDNINSSIMNLLIHVDDDGRAVLPLYIVTRIILYFLKSNNIDIVLILRDMSENKESLTLYYHYDNSTSSYTLCNEKIRTNFNSNDYGFIVHAITSKNINSDPSKRLLIDLIEKIGIENSLLANMASHHQYSGRKLRAVHNDFLTPIIACSNKSISNSAIKLDREYKEHLLLSNEFGCSERNRSLFFIRHIFCGNIGVQLKFAQARYFYCDLVKHKSIIHNLAKQDEETLIY